MDIQHLAALIGRGAAEPQVQELLLRLGLPAKPKIPRADVSVYLNKPDQGISLMFEDASYFRQETGRQVESDDPVLVAMFFYGPGNDGFKEFRGNLPSNVRFGSSQEELQSALGASVLFDEEFNTEAWDLGDGLRVFVDYAEGRKCISQVQIGLAPPD